MKTMKIASASEVVVATDRDRPNVVPSAVEDEDGVAVIPARRPFASVRDKKVPPTNTPVDSLRALIEERGSR